MVYPVRGDVTTQQGVQGDAVPLPEREVSSHLPHSVAFDSARTSRPE